MGASDTRAAFTENTELRRFRLKLDCLFPPPPFVYFYCIIGMCPRKVRHIIRKYKGINFWLSDLFRLRDSRVNELGERELKGEISFRWTFFGCLLCQQQCKITKKLQQSFPTVFLNNVSYFTLVSNCPCAFFFFFCFRVLCESSGFTAGELLPGALLCEGGNRFVFLFSSLSQGGSGEAEQFDTPLLWQSC